MHSCGGLRFHVAIAGFGLGLGARLGLWDRRDRAFIRRFILLVVALMWRLAAHHPLDLRTSQRFILKQAFRKTFPSGSKGIAKARSQIKLVNVPIARDTPKRTV